MRPFNNHPYLLFLNFLSVKQTTFKAINHNQQKGIFIDTQFWQIKIKFIF